MSTLYITNNFQIDILGQLVSGQQGSSTTPPQDGYAFTVSGEVLSRIGSVATATVKTIYDDDSDFPADWDYLWFKADQDVYLQIIMGSSNFTVKVEANLP